MRTSILPGGEVAPALSVFTIDAFDHRPARQVHALTQEMKARGERVVSLCVGEPDFQPPPAVIEATAAAAKEVSVLSTPRHYCVVTYLGFYSQETTSGHMAWLGA